MRSDNPEVHLVPAQTHGRVLVRHARGEPRGILAGFHGYMENAAIQMSRLEAIGGDDWTLMSVQALHRFYRGRSEEIAASWMTREDRESAIADNIAYVTAALGLVGSTHVVHVGFSQGVAMAFRAGAHSTPPAAGIIAVGGDVPPELLADRSIALPPVFLARGTSDEWYTSAKLEADVSALRARGTDVHPFIFDAGHEWTREIAEAAAKWLAGSGR